MEDLVTKYKEFAEYLDGVDLSNVKEDYTREEIKEIERELRDIKLRFITLELSDIEKEMKEEEYPEILGVHHYPEIKEITFLTEDKKLELDKYLIRFRVGTYVSRTGLYRIAYDNVDKLVEWLLSRGIMEEEYLLRCMYCREDSVGKLTKEEKDLVDKNFEMYKETGEYEYLEKMGLDIRGYCMECDTDIDEQIEEAIRHNFDLIYETIYKLVKERDKTYDKL